MRIKNANYDVIVVGAGLSGLATALLLKEAGKKVCVLEARSHVGGRIQSVFDETGTNHLADLGPTWVWPEYQNLISLWIEKLGLKLFSQFDTGNAILDYGEDQTPQAQPIPGQHGSMRVVGGSQALIDACAKRVGADLIFTDTKVISIEAGDTDILIETNAQTYTASRIIIATPPRIALKVIEWKTSLPQTLKDALLRTPTWMAPHAKVSIVYEHAFWREQGLSGRIASRAGPIVEGHDHCSEDGSTSALWGFIGIPHDIRIGLGEAALKELIYKQLKRCFGENSPEPVSITVKDWAQEEFTTSSSDLNTQSGHPDVGPVNLRNSYLNDRLWFSGAETAEKSPGLIEGAFDSAERVAAQVLKIF